MAHRPVVYQNFSSKTIHRTHMKRILAAYLMLCLKVLFLFFVINRDGQSIKFGLGMSHDMTKPTKWL